MKIELESYDELLVLHRALMERHFVEEVHALELVGSPLLASISRNIIDLIIEHEVKTKGSAARAKWDDWRTLTPKKGIAWNTLLVRLSDDGIRKFLKNSPAVQQDSFIRDVASPFQLTDDVLDKLKARVLTTPEDGIAG